MNLKALHDDASRLDHHSTAQAHTWRRASSPEKETSCSKRVQTPFSSDRVSDNSLGGTRRPGKRSLALELLPPSKSSRKTGSDVTFNSFGLGLSNGIESSLFAKTSESQIRYFWQDARPYCFAVRTADLVSKNSNLRVTEFNPESIFTSPPPAADSKDEVLSEGQPTSSKVVGLSTKTADFSFFVLEKSSPNQAFFLGSFRDLIAKGYIIHCMYSLLIRRSEDEDDRDNHMIPYSIIFLSLLLSKGHIVQKNTSLAEALLNAQNLKIDQSSLDFLVQETRDASMIKFLLDSGANPHLESGSIFSMTPLQGAVMSKNLDRAKVLLDAGARVDLATEDEDSPWDMSSESPSMRKLLTLYK